MKGISVCNICSENNDNNIHFFCPVDGIVHQNNVLFLCNTCKQEEMIYKDGMYVCPDCLTETNSLQCKICGSTEVTFPEKEMDALKTMSSK